MKGILWFSDRIRKDNCSIVIMERLNTIKRIQSNPFL